MIQQENQLWKIATKRAKFKRTLTSYVLVNAFLVAVWYFSNANYFWPKWCMLGWGIGLFMQYLDAYHGNQIFSTEKEYEKLKKETAY